MTFADVSIIIPTYQGEATLGATLAAIRQQHYPGKVEIVAVDSGSTDGTLALLHRYGAEIISIPHAQFTHGYARNIGVCKAQYPVIVLMSQDALPADDRWLATLVGSLDDPSVGAAYARQAARPEATALERFFQLELYPAKSKRYGWQPGKAMPLEKIFFSNVCSVTRREMCLRFPFDEALIMSEDQAFARALLLHGYETLYNAEAVVIHSHHYDLKSLFRRNFDSAYSLRGITQDTWAYTMRKGIDYALREVAYVISERAWRSLALLPAYEAARTLGRIMGRYADRLPVGWRPVLSLHRDYWSRY